MSLEVTLSPSTRLQKGWNWRRDLNYFFVALTEIFWLAPLMELIGTFTSDNVYPHNLGIIFIMVSINILVAMSLRRFLIFKRRMSNKHSRYFYIGIGISLFLTLLFMPFLTQTGKTLDTNFGTDLGFKNATFPPVIIYLGVITLLWYRGFQIGKASLTHITVSLQMRLGILMFFFIALIGTAQLQEDMLTLLPFFFGSGLMASALARSATLHIDEDERSRFGISWLGFLIMIVLVIVVIAFIAALLMAGIDRNQAFDVLKLIGAGFLTLIFILASPFLWAANEFFTWLGSAKDTNPEAVEESGKIIPGSAKDVDRWDYSDELSAVIHFVTTWGFYIMIALVTMLVLYFWFTFLFTRDNVKFDYDDDEDVDERELIGGIRKTIGNQLKKLGDMFNIVRQFGFGSDLMGVLTIRWAYSRMEREAKKRGFARSKSQTPYEYRRMVAKAFPGGEEQIRVITDAYVAIRYGELPENNDRLDRVRQALDQLMEIEAPATASG
jgi:hypothetical protein